MYHDLGAAFIANMVGKPRMLQVGLQVRSYYPTLSEFLKHNDPALRHAILNLLSTQDGQALKSLEGKDKLREDIKQEINKLINRYQGPGEVDEVFFSSFVMQ
jgi:flagellar FliL protein